MNNKYKFNSLKNWMFLAFATLGSIQSFSQLYPFTDHTFTNASAEGRTGPTLVQCQVAYSPAAWVLDPAFFNMSTQGIQEWTVPSTGDYRITAAGAQGGDDVYVSGGNAGGLGATIQGEFSFTEGDILYILVGQRGGNTLYTDIDNASGGGGGGSFVWDPTDPTLPLVAAGGGGGASSNTGTYSGIHGNATEDGSNAEFISNGGTAGNGGRNNASGSSYWAGGGAGWLTNGTAGNTTPDYTYNGLGDYGKANGGRRPLDGGLGGERYNDGTDEGGDGGFGGGGGGGSDNMGAGGAGGYSGGGADRGGTYGDGGGGGSYNAGIAQVNLGGNNAGQGWVYIELLCTPLTTTIPVTGVCIGEELTLTAVSETGGTITWSGGVTNGVAFAPPLGTTMYSAFSTSPDDCNFEIAISASEIPDIVAHSSTPAACEGAVITVWGTGGDTYTWTGTGDVDPVDSVAFGAEPGTVTYTVVGSILGCEGPSDFITLAGAPQPDVIATATPAEICLGESYTLTGSGALAVDFYWGGGIEDGDAVTPESAGTYVHTVVGASGVGCTDTTTVTVIVNANPMVNAGMDVAVCEGMDVVLTASGASSYTWTPAITDGVAFPALVGETTYTVVGTDANGCTDDDAVVVTGVDIPEIASAIIEDEYFGYDGSIDITVTGGSGSYIFEWSHGPITEDVYSLTGGTYTVTIDDITIDKGMCSYEETFVVDSYMGITDANSTVVNAYPNPTTDQLTVVCEGQFTYQVVNVLGEVVINGSAYGQTNLSMKDLANGTYVVKVMAGDNINVVQVVKQ